jgi:tetratricopeptide (TPR) repeat protein
MSRSIALVLLFVCASFASKADTFLILPFFNVSKAKNLDWVGESVSERIREVLAAEGIIALERDDRQEAYKRLTIRPNTQLTKASVVVLGESLDADQVIYGMYELIPPTDPAAKTRGTLRITAQILDLKKMLRGPEYMELGPLEDLAKLQTLLAWQTLQFVVPKRAPSQQEFLNKQAPIRVDALENYIRGLLATNPDQKLTLFTQAVHLEPKYSQANYQLGYLNWQKKNYKIGADFLQKVAPSDDHYREANFFLGLCRYALGDFAGAQSSFELVARDVPLNEVLNNIGAAQSRRNLPAALDSFQKAMDGDPADPDYQFNVGIALFKQGKLDLAADRFRAVLERSPEEPVSIRMLGRCLKGTLPRQQERAEPLERLKTNYSESAYWQLKNLLEPKK